MMITSGELAIKRMKKTTLSPLSCTLDTDNQVHTGHRYTDLESGKGTRADHESWHCPERKEET
jgi:hypothetical protein